MRFYTKNHTHYCGIDLHAKTMYLCILDDKGQVVLHKDMKSRPDTFLAAVEPFRQDLVVAVECIFTWYWLADLCRQEGIEFVLGHALYMKAIHGGKAKNDKIDSFQIATLLRGGSLPKAYAYPHFWGVARALERQVRRAEGGAAVCFKSAPTATRSLITPLFPVIPSKFATLA